MSRKYAQNGLEGLFKQQTIQWPGQFDNREEGSSNICPALLINFEINYLQGVLTLMYVYTAPPPPSKLAMTLNHINNKYCACDILVQLNLIFHWSKTSK